MALIGCNLLTLPRCTLARNKLAASGSVFRSKMNYNSGVTLARQPWSFEMTHISL
jgi:hypothetical protein